MSSFKNKMVLSILNDGWQDTIKLFRSETSSDLRLQIIPDYISERAKFSNVEWKNSKLFESCGLYAVDGDIVIPFFIFCFSVYITVLVKSGYISNEYLASLDMNSSSKKDTFQVNDYFEVTHWINLSTMPIDQKDFTDLLMEY